MKRSLALSLVLICASFLSAQIQPNKPEAVKLTDGTNNAAVKAASTAATATDPAAVVSVSPNSPLPAGTNLVGKVGLDQTTPGTTNGVRADTSGATGSAAPSRADLICGTDGTNCVAPYIDPCQRGIKTYIGISLTAGATLVTGTSAKQTYICSIQLISASADNIAIVEGTGTVCATGIGQMKGIGGGTTAATGWNLPANGGIVLGVGGFAIGATTTAADNVCILVSGATQVTGGLTYVQF